MLIILLCMVFLLENLPAWEYTTNNALLHLTPAGRYLEVIATLTSTLKNISPVLYDLTITPLSEAPINNTNLSLSILSDTYTPSVNSTIRIVLHAGNNGPNDATSVRVNYRLPFGLQYQNTNGNYNHNTGLWTVGNLASGTTTTLEIIARIINSGSLMNTGTIISTEFDPNAANNRANLTINVLNPAAEEELPEVPPNLPSAGEATLPPIPNIEEGMDLDPNDPKLGPGPGPGPDPSPGPKPDDEPFPPSPLYTPKTQLQRDIAGVRQAVQSDSFKDQMNRPLIPEWNPQPGNDTDNQGSDDKVNEEWRSVLLKFAGDVIFFAAFSLIPNEYLKGVGSSLLNAFETLGTIAKYFGYGKQVKQIADLVQRSKGVLLNPYFESFISKWSVLMDILDFNVGMKLLEWALIKIFPKAVTEIKLMFAVISTANFALDPFGTLKIIMNLACAMFTKNIPTPVDLIKLL